MYPDSVPTPLKAAITEFQQARMQAAMQQITARLRGKSANLLSFDEVAEQLKITGRTSRGLQTIPLEAIVGSVGRYTDFTRTFLPRLDADQDRWAAIKAAAASMTDLPPIEVYQIGETYFVLDGNHRVSIARRQGLSYIDAYVTEVRTRVPLSPDVQPDELIIKAEYAAFLEFTRLDQLRPGADLSVSVPGQYARLENHIEVHRYFVEVAEEREISDEEAVCRWYDEAYLPIVDAIREQGILRYFPGRTETDFYVWLSRHRAALQNELGWQIRPGVAVARLADRVRPASEGRMTRVYRHILNVVVPERWKGRPKVETWTHEKVLDRYSQRLFADLLVPGGNATGNWPALEQALIVAARENAQVCGLHIVADETEKNSPAVQAMQQALNQRCRENGVSGYLAVEAGKPVDQVCERAVLTDLVILDRTIVPGQDDETFYAECLAVLQRCVRPVLVVSDQPSALSRVLLAYDGQDKAQEALFVAAYLAEQWRVSLTVLAVLEPGRTDAETLAHARKYLAMHEIEAAFLTMPGPVATTILQTAATHNCDLIVMGGYSAGHGRRRPGSTVQQVLRQWQQPLLICP